MRRAGSGDLHKAISSLETTRDNRVKQFRAEEAKRNPDRAYLARELVQCTLPHSDPGKTEVWSRSNGQITLMIDSGKDPRTMKPYGIPYGVIPRLMLYYLNTEAVKTRSRTIYFGRNLHAFMRAIGLNPNNGSGKRSDYRRMIEQCNRLFNARITFASEATDRYTAPRVDLLVAEKQDLWWTPSSADEDTIFESWIELSEKFFDAVTSNPVPVDMNALKILKRSPLALDLYGWATYRTYLVNQKGEPERIPLVALRDQFGAEYADTPQGQKDFNRKFRQALEKVKKVYPDLTYTLEPGVVILHPAATAIPSR